MKKKVRIGEVSKIKNIDAQTLRYYDKLGILTPGIIDPENGYRYYTEDQLIEVDKVKFLRALDLSLEEIREYNNETSIDVIIETLLLKQKEVKDKIKHLKLIDKSLSLITKDLNKASKILKEDQCKDFIKIVNLDSIYGITVDFNGENGWMDIEKNLTKLIKTSTLYSEVGHNYGFSFICTNEHLYTPNERYVEKVILPVNKSLKKHKNIKEYSFGETIVGYHKGEFSDLSDIFLKIRNFIKENNLKIRGDIILTPLVNSFILSDNNRHIMEIKVPLYNKNFN